MKKQKKELKRIFVLVLSIALIGSSIDISTVTVSATEAAKSQETQSQVTECEHNGDNHTVTCGNVEKGAEAVLPATYEGSLSDSANEKVSTLTTESADADVAQTFDLYVNGTKVTDSNGAIEGYTLSDSNAGWSYAPATGTLTLTDAVLTNGEGSYGAAIYWRGGDLTIELVGTNTIDVVGEFSIFFKADTNDRTFTINGPGTLNVNGSIYHEYSTGEGKIVIAEGAVVNTSELSGLGNVSITDSTVIADGSGWAGIYSEADVVITNSYVVAKSGDGSGIQVNGNLTIADSQVEVAGSRGDIANAYEKGFSNSIVTVGTETTVTGTATLKEELSITSDESINFEEGASITNLEKLTVEEGATVEANGAAHTHNTDGAVTYIQADKSKHVKKVVCKDCPIGYSIESGEAHSFEGNTCIYCGITKVDLGGVTAHTWTSVDGGEMESEISGETGGAINTLGVAYDAAGTTTFENGDAIKIINTKSAEDNQGIYTFDGTSWKSGTDTYVSWNTEGENQFQAIYPTAADYDGFLLPGDQSTLEKQKSADWMTASTESMSKSDDNILDLDFEHMLSRVTVKITQWGDEFSGDADVTEMRIYSKGTKLTVDNNGEIICGDNMTGIQPYEEGSDTYIAIIAPGEYASSDNLITMEVNGSARAILAKADVLTKGLEAGKHYTFNLSVGEDEVTIAGITVSDWETENINMGGDFGGSMPVNANISNGKLTGNAGVTVTSLYNPHFEKFHSSNVKFSYDADAGWRTDSPIYYEGYPSDQTISAYAPYNENGIIDIMLPEVQAEDFVLYDYLWALESSLESDTVSLTMQHLLSAVSIGVSDGNSLTDNETIMDVRLEGMVNGAAFDAATGLDTTNVVTDQTFTMYQSGDGIYQALVIPYEYDTFTVKVLMSNGDIYKGDIRCIDGKMEAGKCYLIALALTECEKSDNEGHRFVWNETAGKWVCAEDTQHVGGTATCSNQAKCELCGEAYGELDASVHEEIYAVTDNTVTTSTITGSCSGCKKSLGSITLSAPDADSLIYNGVVKVAYLDGSIDGVNDPVITYNTSDGNVPVNAGDYAASITLGEGENAVTASVPFTIEKAELKVIGANAKGKVYDGTNVVEITDVVIKGIFIPDEVYVPVSGLVGTVSSANAGNYMEVTLPELSLSGAAAANYTLVQPTEAFAVDLNITEAAAPTVDVINKKYLYSRENTGAINLAALLPADCGAVFYNRPQVAGDVTYSVTPTINKGELSYTVNSGAVDSTGTITVVVETNNYEDITITINITLTEQISIELQEGTEVTLQNNTLTYGKSLSKLKFNNAVFVDDCGNVVAGTLAWKEPMATPNVGTTSATWVFTPADSDYASVEGTVDIVVNKATPDVSVLPTVAERVYNPEKLLADSNMTGGTVLGVDGAELEGIWSWENTAIIPEANNSGYTAVFTPVDTANYEVITKTIAVPVTKATPFIVQMPEAESVSYGDALSASQLSGGAAIYGNGAGEAGEEEDLGISMVIGVSQRPVAGSFAWKDGSIKPTVADSNTTPYMVVFTPNDTVNYNSVELTLSLTVGKAAAPFVMPPKNINVPYSQSTVGAVTLPNGWSWQETDKNIVLTVGVPVTAKAVYIAADKDNFETLEATVTITRAACGHVWNGGVITTKPTATKTGVKTYTCTDCGATRTEAVAALGAPKKGTMLKDSKNKAYYKVSKSGLKNGTVEYVKPVNKKAAAVTIPTTIKVDGITYKVTGIAKNAFKSNKKVTKITIGSNVKTIGANAFYGCTRLKTLTIGKNVTTIGDKAFYKCTALTKVTIPSKVTKIGKSAFYGCKKLKTITIKTTKLSNSRVGGNAFKGIYSKAVIKVPKAKVKAYTTLLKKKGIGKTVTVKKY